MTPRCFFTIVLLTTCSATQAFVFSPPRAVCRGTAAPAGSVHVIAPTGTKARLSAAARSRHQRRTRKLLGPSLAARRAELDHGGQERVRRLSPAAARDALVGDGKGADSGESIRAAKTLVYLAALGSVAAALTVVWHPDGAHAADVLASGPQVSLVSSQLTEDPLAAFAANPEWTRYAFMLPIGIFVATCAQIAGIGGAAIMGPFFVLGLPLLGPEYPLHGVAASVASAILTEAFGFSSGLFGYFKRGLVDVGSAVPFIVTSLPACLLGAVVVPYTDERVLKALYAVLMIGLSVYLLFGEQGSEYLEMDECSVKELESGEIRAICTAEGKEYIYRKPDFGAQSGLSTAFGGLMTGMLGVGIGEVVMPQLVKKYGVPLPVVAGTSVLVVFLNAVVAAGTQISGILARGGDVVPWNLIAFIVPGVIIGGQLAPRMQGMLSQRTMEKILAGIFGVVGTTFATISLESLIAATSASATLPLEIIQ